MVSIGRRVALLVLAGSMLGQAASVGCSSEVFRATLTRFASVDSRGATPCPTLKAEGEIENRCGCYPGAGCCRVRLMKALAPRPRSASAPTPSSISSTVLGSGTATTGRPDEVTAVQPGGSVSDAKAVL